MRLVFMVADPSGIDRVEMGFTTRGVMPITPPTSPWPLCRCRGGGREDRYTFSYEAGVLGSEERPLRSRLAVAIEAAIAVGAPLVRFTMALIAAALGDGTNLGTRRFTVARPEAACG